VIGDDDGAAFRGHVLGAGELDAPPARVQELEERRNSRREGRVVAEPVDVIGSSDHAQANQHLARSAAPKRAREIRVEREELFDGVTGAVHDPMFLEGRGTCQRIVDLTLERPQALAERVAA